MKLKSWVNIMAGDNTHIRIETVSGKGLYSGGWEKIFRDCPECYLNSSVVDFEKEAENDYRVMI